VINVTGAQFYGHEELSLALNKMTGTVNDPL